MERNSRMRNVQLPSQSLKEVYSPSAKQRPENSDIGCRLSLPSGLTMPTAPKLNAKLRVTTVSSLSALSPQIEYSCFSETKACCYSIAFSFGHYAVQVACWHAEPSSVRTYCTSGW